jgi:cytochrome P450
MQGVSGTFLEQRRPSILQMEGDEHARQRRLVTPAFTPSAADRMRPFMRAIIGEFVDAVYADGACDFVTDIAERYSVPIICELLGAPRQDWKLFSQWATDIFRLFNQNLVEDLPTVQQALADLETYMRALVEQRRDDPGDDLLSALITLGDEDDRLSVDELIMLAEAVLMAGIDTTRNQLACTVALLLDHPPTWRELVAHPDLAPRVVEETVRYQGAVQATLRVASEDIEYRDVLIPAGTLVNISLAGVNRDPTAFPDPHHFDVHRASEVPHLTFGSGIHYCLGAHLARAELQEAVTVIAGRMPDLRVAGPVEWKPETFGIWGPAHLPVRWTP